MHQRTGLTPPAVGAVVNSTLALMRVATGDYIVLMPLEVGAILRGEAALSPVLRHVIAHLHRSAHHATNLFRGEALHL